MSDYKNAIQTPNADEDVITRKIRSFFTYWRQIVGVVVALLLLAAIYSYAQSQQRAAERAAWKDIASAMSSGTREELPEKLEKVIADHRKVAAVFYARMKLIPNAFDLGDREAAKTATEDFLKEHPRNYFAPQVRSDYARLLEGEGAWTAAREEYEKVIASKREYLVAEAHLGMARCLEQENRLEDARNTYVKIKTLATEDNWMPRARVTADFRLMALSDGLGGTNAQVVEKSEVDVSSVGPVEEAAVEEAPQDGETGQEAPAQE